MLIRCLQLKRREVIVTMTKNADIIKTATFAGGCFWCIEADLKKIPGVAKVVSGYTGGSTENPTYEEVSSGTSGHVEAVQVFYDPLKITYNQLLDLFWRHIDPEDAGGQFVDRGHQYRSAIFYHDDEQRIAAETSKEELDKSGRFKKPIATEIMKFTKFYDAEAYHQDYDKKNPLRYKSYRQGSGRDRILQSIWDNDKSNVRSATQTGYKRPDDKLLKENCRHCSTK